ncbi:MAG TPA: ATP-binding protein, partial [Bacteroidia bacterium]|nr:ATP-binding protein [Bacteroidia bacterium]
MSELTGEEIIKKLQELLQASEPDFRSILKLSNQLSKLDEKYQRFAIDAKTLIHLGRDSIKDHTTALIELVKNSYDADAHVVDVDIFSNEGSGMIRIADNGFGMKRSELINNWLRIGFSSKRASKLSSLGRRKTGEKGIGRISTDRLGGQLELITKTESDGIVGLKLNWDEFDVEGKDVFDIDIELTSPSKITIPKKDGKDSSSGTEIIIKNIRQPWSSKNIENLYYELAALTSPFNI